MHVEEPNSHAVTNHMVTLLGRLPALASTRISRGFQKVQESLICWVSVLNRAWSFPDARSRRGSTSAAAPLSLNCELAACEETGLGRRRSEAYEYIFPIAGTTHFSQGPLALENGIDIPSPKSQIVRVLADGFILVYPLLPPASRKFADRLCPQPDRPSFFFRIWRRNHSCFS